MAKKYASQPGPDKYEKPNEWKDKILGSFKGGPRNTFIS